MQAGLPRRLVVVAGTRPEIIKIYSVLRGLDKSSVDYEFVWTSQHYDYEMSRLFFDELRLPEPSRYLNIPRGGPLAGRFSSIAAGLAGSIGSGRDMVVYALGDTISTLAAAVASAYSGAAFIHDEAGVRSFDLNMVEEVNRRLADQVAWLHLAPSPAALVNLAVEGVPCGTVVHTGSTLVDAFREVYPVAVRRAPDVLSELGVSGDFVLATIHRRENLYRNRLRRVVEIVLEVVRRYDVEIVLPLHPHTREKLRENGLMEMLVSDKRVKLVKPLGYIEFLAALSRSRAVITDSGGVQQEAFLAGKPILTLRPSTEWVETVLLGYNSIVDVELGKVINALDTILGSQRRLAPPPSIYGDGNSGRRVAKLLGSMLEGSLYGRLASLRDRLARGPLVPSRPGSVTGSNELSTICCGRRGIVVGCRGWGGENLGVLDPGGCCLALSQFRLDSSADVERLKKMISLDIDWGRVDALIDAML